jgi:hypothetical protein
MKFEKYLTEKWIHSTKVRVGFQTKDPTIVEIFHNPSKSEYRDVAKASVTGSIPALRGRLATGFITSKGDVWLWRGDIWHDDIPPTARKVIGKGMKGFHFGFSKNELSLYTSFLSGQITPEILPKLVDRLAKIEPKLSTAMVYVDDMDMDI